MQLYPKEVQAWSVTTDHDLSSTEFRTRSPCEGISGCLKLSDSLQNPILIHI